MDVINTSAQRVRVGMKINGKIIVSIDVKPTCSGNCYIYHLDDGTKVSASDNKIIKVETR